jgi:hypothetical protein
VTSGGPWAELTRSAKRSCPVRSAILRSADLGVPSACNYNEVILMGNQHPRQGDEFEDLKLAAGQVGPLAAS